MKVALLAALLWHGGGAAAPADPFCQDVRLMAAAAAEASPFRSLHDRDFKPRLTRGYCFFNSAQGYTCGHNLAQRNETRQSYAARIHACLPGSTRGTIGRVHGFAEDVVRLGRFEARIAEHGMDRGKVGRTINIYIAAVP
jgi:hypothetical protein